jgi:DnaJ-class molecular chaperone
MSEESDSEDRAEASHGPRECMPCHGSGQVISNLGGTATRVPCPWCGGGGVRLTGIDTQASWLDGDRGAGAAPDGPRDAAV